MTSQSQKRPVEELLTLRPEGLYCPAGDFYIDPWRRVQRAVTTHAHSDHARWGSKLYLSHPLTAAVLRHRLGANTSILTLQYGETLACGGVKVSLHPAGHVPGSSQVRVEYRGEVWVVSGDYKLDEDGVTTPFEPVPCHTFISECTFGLPIYQWARQDLVFAEINNWWRENRDAGRSVVLNVYSLGKAQRVLQNLDHAIGDVYAHGSVLQTNLALESAGLSLKRAKRVEASLRSAPGSLVLAPPSVVGSPWLQPFEPYVVGAASGWMALRKHRERRGIDRGFVLSDHADFRSLVRAVRETRAERVFTTHGYTEAFSRYLIGLGLRSLELSTPFAGEVQEHDFPSGES